MFAIPLLGRSEAFDPKNRISMKGSYFQTNAQSCTSLETLARESLALEICNCNWAFTRMKNRNK